MILLNLENLDPDPKLNQQKTLRNLFVEFLFAKNSEKCAFPTWCPKIKFLQQHVFNFIILDGFYFSKNKSMYYVVTWK